MLVIGASGLVGGNLLHLSPHYQCVVIPAFHKYFPGEYRETALELDITDPHAVQKGLEVLQLDCVVNLSCMEVAQAETDPERARQVHADGVQELASACKDYNIRFIHLSTDMVYSGEKGMPYTLQDEPDPISVYGRTKLEGEKAIQGTGCNFVILRSALVLGRGRFRKGGFLDWMVEKIVKGEKIPLYADQLRTPIVVDDLVDVIFRLAASSFTGTLLVGGDEGLNRVEVGEKLLSSMRLPRELIKPILAAEQKSFVPLQRDLRLDNTTLKEIVAREKFMRIEDYFLRLSERGELINAGGG